MKSVRFYLIMVLLSNMLIKAVYILYYNVLKDSMWENRRAPGENHERREVSRSAQEFQDNLKFIIFKSFHIQLAMFDLYELFDEVNFETVGILNWSVLH